MKANRFVFCVPGAPMGKERPRFDSRRMCIYTPGRTGRYELVVKQAAKVAGAPHFGKGRVAVEVSLYLPDARRRDADNLAKSILDALNGVTWDDDSQVWDLHVRKAISRDNPRAVVTVAEMAEEAA